MGIEKKVEEMRKNSIPHNALDVLHHQTVTLPFATVIKRLLHSTSVSTGLKQNKTRISDETRRKLFWLFLNKEL